MVVGMALHPKLNLRRGNDEQTEAVTGRDLAHDREGSLDDAWYDADLGVFGPAFWAAVLAAESARCKRNGRTSTVVLVEVAAGEPDGWTTGHALAERAIRRVAPILTAGVRKSDFVARTGLRRFSVLLTETDEVDAINFVERVRAKCNHGVDEYVPGGRCAFGWAQATKACPLTAAADAALSRLRRDVS
jgi:diguanylate cyclase (GGDEF)-like protein